MSDKKVEICGLGSGGQVAHAALLEVRVSIRGGASACKAERAVGTRRSWDLVASLGDEPRTLKVSNIDRAVVLREAIRRPKKFELVAYWNESIKRFERELYKGEATLLATAAGLKGLCYVNSAVARAVAAAPPPQRKDGRVKVRIPIESVEHATGQLLRLSAEIEVIEPDSLRVGVVERVRRLARLYGIEIKTLEN